MYTQRTVVYKPCMDLLNMERPAGVDEFEWRQFYTSLVAQIMERSSIPPDLAAPEAFARFQQEWRAVNGGEELPFEIRVPKRARTEPAPGGLTTTDGRVWIPAVFAETERTNFGKGDRFTHAELESFPRVYNPRFRRCPVLFPDGTGPGHGEGGRYSKRSHGWFDAFASDGTNLWGLVADPEKGLGLAGMTGLEHRSISWWPLNKELDPPGPYPEHLAILPHGEPPGQPAHVPNSVFAGLVAKAFQDDFPKEAPQAIAQRSAETGDTVSRVFTVPLPTEKRELMSKQKLEEPAADTAVDDPKAAGAPESKDRAAPTAEPDEGGMLAQLRRLLSPNPAEDAEPAKPAVIEPEPTPTPAAEPAEDLKALRTLKAEIEAASRTALTALEALNAATQEQTKQRALMEADAVREDFQKLVADNYAAPAQVETLERTFFKEDGTLAHDRSAAAGIVEGFRKGPKLPVARAMAPVYTNAEGETAEVEGRFLGHNRTADPDIAAASQAIADEVAGIEDPKARAIAEGQLAKKRLAASLEVPS